jgi:hypothetical protein
MNWWSTVSPNQQKAVMIFVIFFIYVVTLIIFGQLYFFIFKRRPSSFVFATNIVEGQRANRLAETREEIDTAKTAASILSEAGNILEKEPECPLVRDKWSLNTAAGTLRYGHVTQGLAPAGTVRISTMFVETGDGSSTRRLHSWVTQSRFFKKYTTTSLRQELVRERSVLNGMIDQAARFYEQINAGSPQIWTFADFFYFSVIIQSTVGLGDIQPNSTTIRKIVVGQVLIGYVILVVLLNILLTWQ